MINSSFVHLSLNDYIADDNNIIVNKALKLKEYIEDLKENKISKEEYADLVSDLFDLNKIEEISTDAEVKILLKKVFEDLIIIAGFIPK